MVEVTRSWYTNPRGERFVVEVTKDRSSYTVKDESGHTDQYGGPGAHQEIEHAFGISLSHPDNQITVDSLSPYSSDFESSRDGVHGGRVDTSGGGDSGTRDPDDHTPREQDDHTPREDSGGGSHPEPIESHDGDTGGEHGGGEGEEGGEEGMAIPGYDGPIASDTGTGGGLHGGGVDRVNQQGLGNRIETREDMRSITRDIGRARQRE
jgi:hypothetical protein